MMWLLSSVVLLLLTHPVAAVPPHPQETIAEAPVQEFFSGVITEVPEGRVTVLRTVSGKAPETRTFLLNSDTKIEGKLRAKARVTVGYKSTDDGDVAVRIIVRNQSAAPKK